MTATVSMAKQAKLTVQTSPGSDTKYQKRAIDRHRVVQQRGTAGNVTSVLRWTWCEKRLTFLNEGRQAVAGAIVLKWLDSIGKESDDVE